MENQINELKNYLSNSKSVLILLPTVINTDVISSCLSLYNILTTTMRKETLIGSSVEIPVRFKRMCDDFGVQEKFILRELKPLQYVFSLPDLEKDMGVNLKRDNGKISLSITPAKAQLNPSMVSFSVVGEKFDTVITIGAKSFDSIGHFYKKELFDSFNVVNIDMGKFNTQYGKVNIVDNKASSVSEVMYDVFKQMNIKVDGKIADAIYRGMIAGSRAFKNISSPKLFKVLAELAEAARYDEVIDDYMYSLSPQGLTLRSSMFRNIQLDANNKAIVSKIHGPDFKDLGVNPENLIGMDYLPYDIVEGFTKSALVYDAGNGKSNALIFGHDKKVEVKSGVSVYQNGDVVDIRGEISLPDMEGYVKSVLGGSFAPVKSTSEPAKPAPQQTPTAPKPQHEEPKVESSPFTKSTPVHHEEPKPEPKFGPQAPFKKASL